MGGEGKTQEETGETQRERMADVRKGQWSTREEGMA
jgi:hypothetical protein